MQQHADPTVLVDYALGRLSRRSAAEVRAHCLRCGECGDQLAAAIALRMHVSEAVDPGVDWRRVAAVAAAVVLAVGIAAIGFVGDGSSARGTAKGVEMVADGLVTAADSPRTSRASAEDLAYFDRRVGLLRLMLGTTAQVSYGDDRETRLRVALKRLGTGDLAGMAQALEPFAESYDPWGTPLLGIARYLDGDQESNAIVALNAAHERAFRESQDPGDSYFERLAALYFARLERDRGQSERADDILLALLPYEDILSADARGFLDEGRSASH